MRHAHHTAGSAAAQRDLQAIAGWTQSRRGILTGLLALGATPAMAALPATSAAPDSVPLTSVSPRMAELIADLMSRNAAVDALGSDADADRWADAAESAADALDALVKERPASLVDYAAKISAMAEATPDECGTYPLHRLAEDIVALVGETK